MCGQTQQKLHDSLPAIADYADGFEKAVVRAFRCIATASTTGDAAWYVVAHHHCVGAVGERSGGRLVGEVMTLLSAVQKERKVPLTVMSPDCGRITPDEECLIAALRQAGHVPGGVAAATVNLSGASTPDRARMISTALETLGAFAKELRFGEGYGHAGLSAALLH